MTTKQPLAKIERVDPRDVWPNEAQDFTPWLAEHLDELGEALGLDLELQSEEAPVGGFSLDILAREVGRDRPVIIENQLEQTNHSHLGQLLTYAAGYDAGVVIWIAKEFRDEHRAALDLLNQHTDDEIEFFGVVVEVWRIAESLPAPNFKVICAPNEWRKQGRQTGVVGKGSAGESEKGERYREFYQPLFDTLRSEHRFTNATKAQPQSWYHFGAGHGQRVKYDVAVAAGKATVGLYIDNGNKEWNEATFDRLFQDKDAVEYELQHTVDWRRLDARRACRILVDRPGSIDDDAETLEEIRQWMIDRLLKYKEVFGPRLAEL